MSMRQRTLHYRRAVFLTNPAYQPRLDFFVRDVHGMFRTTEDRQVSVGDSVIECRRYRETQEGVLMQLVSYCPGEEMSIVPHHKAKNNLDLGTTPPPDGTDFWDGDVNVFISENHIVYCASQATEKYIDRYIVGMCHKKSMTMVLYFGGSRK